MFDFRSPVHMKLATDQGVGQNARWHLYSWKLTIPEEANLQKHSTPRLRPAPLEDCQDASALAWSQGRQGGLHILAQLLQYLQFQFGSVD